MTKRKILVLLSAVLFPLTAIGVSAAVEGDPVEEPPPAEEAPHGAAVSEAAKTCPEGPEHGPCVAAVASAKDDTDDEDAVEEEEPVEDEDSGPPEDTHGAAVSEAAKTCPEGPEHGACVREVATSKSQGKGQGSGDDEGDDEGDDDAGGPPAFVPGSPDGGEQGGPPEGRGRRP